MDHSPVCWIQYSRRIKRILQEELGCWPAGKVSSKYQTGRIKGEVTTFLLTF
jgi:hypothetical protein